MLKVTATIYLPCSLSWFLPPPSFVLRCVYIAAFSPQGSHLLLAELKLGNGRLSVISCYAPSRVPGRQGTCQAGGGRGG